MYSAMRAGSGGRDHVDEAGVDGAPRHGLEPRGRRRLGEDAPGLLADRPQAEGAVRAHAREHDPDASRAEIVGQRAEEEVDRQALAARRHRIEEVEDAVDDGHVLVRRDHVDVVRPEARAVGDLDDGDRRDAEQKLDEHPFARRIEVLDDDVGHPALRRHLAEEELERLEAPRRCADGHHRKERRMARPLAGRGCRGPRRRLLLLGHDEGSRAPSGMQPAT
jgi:hypothetical protein